MENRHAALGRPAFRRQTFYPPPPEAAHLFDHVTTFDALFSGWEKVEANAGAPGGDGVPAEAFGRKADATGEAQSAVDVAQRTYGPSLRNPCQALASAPARNTAETNVPEFMENAIEAASAVCAPVPAGMTG